MADRECALLGIDWTKHHPESNGAACYNGRIDIQRSNAYRQVVNRSESGFPVGADDEVRHFCRMTN